MTLTSFGYHFDNKVDELAGTQFALRFLNVKSVTISPGAINIKAIHF